MSVVKVLRTDRGIVYGTVRACGCTIKGEGPTIEQIGSAVQRLLDHAALVASGDWSKCFRPPPGMVVRAAAPRSSNEERETHPPSRVQCSTWGCRDERGHDDDCNVPRTATAPNPTGGEAS